MSEMRQAGGGCMNRGFATSERKGRCKGVRENMVTGEFHLHPGCFKAGGNQIPYIPRKKSQ